MTLQPLWQRLALLQEWSGVARACIPVALVGVLYLHYLLWLTVGMAIDPAGRYMNHAAVQAAIPGAQLIVAGAVVLMLLGQYLRKHQPEAGWYMALTALFYALSQVWGGYLVGPLSFVVGVVMTGAPVVGFLMLPRRVTWIATLVAFWVIFATNLAVAYGLLPYAPLLREPYDVASALFWTHSQFFITAPHMLANVVICALVLARWHRREEDVLVQSLTDALTQVHNRRSILDLLQTELARSRRQGTALAVVMLDLDYFKRINDTWGHPVGDRVLREAARILRDSMRQTDEVGRFGGEEFLLLLPDTDRAGAQVLAERCREQLQALAVVSDDGQPVPVSGSFGVACTEGTRWVSAESLVRAADEALYQAKEAGRNRVLLAAVEAAELPAGTILPAEDDTEEVHWHGRLRRLSALTVAVPVAQDARSWWQTPEGWRQQMAGLREWSPVAKTMLLMVVLMVLLAGGLVWLLYVVTHADTLPMLDAGVAHMMLAVVVALLAGAGLLVALGRTLRHRHPESRSFQWLTMQYYSCSTLGLGYILGMLYLPTGLLFTCSPLLGFILFERALVLQVWGMALVGIMALAYVSALGWIPYAPLLLPSGSYQLHSLFWVYSNYLFFLPTLLVVLVLTDQILGRWRAREEQIRTINLTDALTQVHNRRSILDRLDKEVQRCQRQDMPLAMALLDLDHFKKINDSWGHATGDRVLQEAARLLKATLRDSDSVGRFGGEEFLLLLPDTGLKEAQALLERCRLALAAAQVHSEDGQPVKVSASFGLTLREPGQTVDITTLTRRADDALYRAKAAGRNRVEMQLIG